MSVPTAVTEDSEYAEICISPLPSIKVNDGTSVVVMDMAVSGAVADGTSLQFWAKLRHKCVKEKFR